MPWLRLAAASDCPQGEGREIVAGERIVALYNIGGEFFALDGVCPHQGGPLGKGMLHGCVVTCPWHGWQFDVRDGQHQFSPSVRQPTLKLKVESGEVFVDLPHEAE